jgi:hypothetical protein
MRSSSTVGLAPLSQQHLDRFMQLGNLLGALVSAPRSAPGRLTRDAVARPEQLHKGSTRNHQLGQLVGAIAGSDPN